MPTRTLEVAITGDTKGLSKATRQGAQDIDRFEQSGSRSLKNLRTGFLAVGTAAVAGAAFGIKKSAEAAIESEKANARLQAQLKALGISYSAHEAQIQRVIDKHSQLSGFDDEDLGDSFTNIVRVTGDVNKALELNVVAMDFARAKHMDVAKAGELVGKVAGGNTGILSRYGIQVEKGATATEALGLLQRKFAGQAEAYGKTTAGATDRADVALENLGETIGANVTPLIARLAEGFNTLVRQITLGEGPGGRIRALFEQIAGSAVSAYSGLRGLVSGFQQGNEGARALAATLGGVAAGFVAFKVISTVIAGVQALRAAWVGLTAAMASNPIGALAVGIAAVVGAFAVMTARTRQQEVSSRALNDALRAQADALRAVRDIDIDVAQRKANVKSANVAVEQAERRLIELRKDGKKGTLEYRQAEADLRQVKVAQKRATRELSDAEEDSTRKKEDAAQATGKAKAEQDKYNRALDRQIDEKRKEVRSYEDSIQAVKQQGVNNDATRKTVEELRKKQAGLRREIDRLESKKITVAVKVDLSPETIAKRQASGDGIGVRGAVAAAVTHGFNSGQLLPSGSASLDGADFDLGPFARIGAGMGLNVSSGRRPGAITSSGNRSYHASGDAIDMAGPPGAMMRFFQTMRGLFGSRLRELIYTPGGIGIKDGKPYQYGGQVAADHYDHVHVAYTGPFGDGPGKKMGDGLGRFGATSYGPPWGGIQGTGVTATGVNLKPARKAYGVAVDPSVIRLGSKLKIWPNPFGYRGAFTAFDTGGAIKGKRIDFYDWRGRRAQEGWGRRTVTVSTVDGGGGGSPAAKARPMSPEDRFIQSQDNTSDVAGAALRNARHAAGGPALTGAAGIRDLIKRNSIRKGGGDPVSAGDSGDAGGGTDANTAAIEEQNRLLEQRNDLDRELIANQAALLKLANQGDQIVSAVVAAVNGAIGGQVGLGYQSPGYAGGVARY